jgi:hypothetical protein
MSPNGAWERDIILSLFLVKSSYLACNSMYNSLSFQTRRGDKNTILGTKMKITPGKLYAVITGDIVASTKLPESMRLKLHNAMVNGGKELRRIFPLAVPWNLEIFRGDSWQLVVTDPSLSLRIALYYRAFLRAHLEKFKVESRLAIAVGTIDFMPSNRISAGDGQAFQKSGRLLEKIPKHSRMTFAIAGREKKDINLVLEIVVLLLDTLAKRWTPRQAQAIAYVMQGWTQEKIANNFLPNPISQQAVAQHLDRAEWFAIEKGLIFFEQRFKDLST